MWQGQKRVMVKFRCSEKATKFWKILRTFCWCYQVTSYLMGDFFSNFIAFSEYLNFKWRIRSNLFFIDFLICYNLQNDSKCRYVFYTWHISRIQFAEAQNNYNFFIMSMEFDKNISDWRHYCTDYKNDLDFFLRLAKWPKIAVKKKPNF